MSGFDPLTIVDKDFKHNYANYILYLCQQSYLSMNISHCRHVKALFGRLPLKSIQELDHKLNKLVGAFVGPIYSFTHNNYLNRLQHDLMNHVCTCCESRRHVQRDYELNDFQNNTKNGQIENKYTKHHMLRDLFLWYVFMDMPEMAKVLLFHVRARICAALIASAIFKKYSELSQTIRMKDRFRDQSLEFGTYAAMFIDKCYEYNEKRACELLLRNIPLFGNVTCIQLAVLIESDKLIGTASFDEALNQVWYDKLSMVKNQHSTKLLIFVAIVTFGFLAPLTINYQEAHVDSLNVRKKFGLFNYMMLYHLDGRNTFDVPHWTEIYVIITVSTMLCEEIRERYHEYTTRTIERRGLTESSTLAVLSNVFYILPYLLFYLGLGFRYASYNQELLTTARIIWALDLELWYLRSLKFVIAFEFVGPKLFMLKNMLRDLFAFFYMIFIAIAAYGVVSRALILYKQVEFTGRGIFSQIFYAPYWFIHGEFSDKELLDELISNDTNSTTGVIAEATVTHVLLAFHILFINILLLNLLIAVFTNTIGKVQENTNFYWRYQRYWFIREYFQRLPLSYPPLIIIPHIILFILTIYHKCCSKLHRQQVADLNHVPAPKTFMRTFKMIPREDSQNEAWDLFENAATHNDISSILKKKSLTTTHEKSSKAMTTIDSNMEKPSVNQQKTLENLYELMSTFQSVLMETKNELAEENSRVEICLNRMNKSLESIMNSTPHAKTNDPKVQRPTSATSSTRSDVSPENRVTTFSTNIV
ncbi:unnamed protein product [Rotaria sp. Silwood1]|nr:unnamed protein product [Rotaria sp. Silwood1]CAF1671477.1 unnamed protein product [Rotaria sp. Silwood1]